MRLLLRLTLGLSILGAMLGAGASPAAAAFTWQGTWNVPSFQTTWNVTGSDTMFQFEDVTGQGTDWENTYSIIAMRDPKTPSVYRGAVSSTNPRKPESDFAGTVELKVNIDGKSFTGTIKYDNGRPSDTINGTCSAGACTKNTPMWPPMPSAVVALAVVANGCGPGTAGSKPRYFDTSKYKDKNTKRWFTVNFRQACNVHDAAYNGARIKDPFDDDKVVDFLHVRRYDIDKRFLDDMRTLCRKQIPAANINARYQCNNKGGTFSTGAVTRFRAVKAVGHRSFVKRPALTERWDAKDTRGKTKPSWFMRQAKTGRGVVATWGKGPTAGQFRGIIITKDEKSLISGFTIAKVNGVTRFGRTMFTWNPNSPNRMRTTGTLGGIVLTR